MSTPAAARRVVVALGTEGATPLAIAAQLAERMGAEVLGLFVEDESWARMAALPFTRVAGHGPLSQRLDPDLLERALRRGAADARRALAAAVRPESRWGFQVVRGFLVPAVVSAAGAEDLVVIAAEAVARGGLEAVVSCRSDLLVVRAGGQIRRVIVPVGAAAEIEAAAEWLAELGGWRLEHAPHRGLDVAEPRRDAILTVAAGDVVGVRGRVPCSLLVVRARPASG